MSVNLVNTSVNQPSGHCFVMLWVVWPVKVKCGVVCDPVNFIHELWISFDWVFLRCAWSHQLQCLVLCTGLRRWEQTFTSTHNTTKFYFMWTLEYKERTQRLHNASAHNCDWALYNWKSFVYVSWGINIQALHMGGLTKIL